MRRVLSWICLLLFSYSTGTLLNVFIRKDLIINVIFSRSTLYYSIFILFSILLLFLFGYRVNGEKEALEENDLEDSFFLSKRKIKKLKEFNLFKLSNANIGKNGRLERNVYFILDEFGNLPKFQDIESMVTVSRSRGIRFLFILQSFSQLIDKYGREKGDIIKTNCNIKMFLGSDDYETRKEFSELCGNRKIKSLSISSSKGNVSSQIGAQNKPLISPSELERINGEKKGEGVVSVRGFYPLFTYLTPSYLLQKYYFTAEEEEEEIEGRCFDEKNSLYDIGELVNGGKEDKEIKEEEKYEEITEEENIEVEDDKFSRDLMISGLIDTLIYRVNKYDKDLLSSIPVNELPIILRTIAPSYPKYSEEFSRLIKLIEEGK